MRSVEKTGRSVEEAIQEALDELGIERDEAEIVVLEEGSKGLFGLLRGRSARVRVGLKSDIMASRTGSDRTAMTSSDEEARRLEDERNAAIERGRLFLAGVLERLGITAGIEIREDDDIVHMNVTGTDLGILIGRKGQTLDSIQYLVNIVANRQGHVRVRIVIDAEGYRERREQFLRGMALRMAERVRRRGRKVVLEPMSALERRVVHMALKDEEDVTTYSEGKDPYRRVVIVRKRSLIRDENI